MHVYVSRRNSMSRRNFLEINVLGDAEMWLVLLVGNPWKLGREVMR